MKKCIKFVFVLFLTILISLNIGVFANATDDSIDYVWLQEEIANAKVNAENELNLSSRYVVAFDRTSKTIIYGKNENKRVPMASTTKIMTAIVLMENLGKNSNLSLNTEVEACKQAASIQGSRLGLKTGDKITINDLLYGLMLCSGNDAAIQIAVTVGGSVENFANLMNKKAEEMGLKDSHFVTPHGLDETEHYTTAYELAQITDYALNIEKIAQVVKTKTYTVRINNNSKTINNTNELLGYLSGVNGVKTGFTNGAGRCLVTSVERDGFSIITVVLGADTKRIRTGDSIKLIEYVYSNYELVNLKELVDEEYQNWARINEKRIYVYKGKKNNVKTKLEDYKYKIYPVKKDEIKNINVEVKNTQMNFEAPTSMNTKVGEIVLNIGEKNVIDAMILTNESVDRKDVWDYVLEYLGNAI